MAEGGTNLGRLERVDLRQAWLTEAGDFTPWLAKEDNIVLLGDAIGIELEVEAQERSVGPFRADILCKDMGSDKWVLIENQLERTDHTHLGQLITYAAGLDAVTIVWVSQRFTEEHRAALDWLNEVTGEEISFFGLEVELWRIGDSPVAPKFNIVSKPNDWTKTVSGAASRFEAAELSETQNLQVEYWSALRECLDSSDSPVRSTKALPQSWMNFSIGRTHFVLMAAMNTRENWVSVTLVLHPPDAKPHFHLLKQEQEIIRADLGEPLEWRELPDRKESHIVLRRNETDPTDKSTWVTQHEWLVQKLTQFHRVFRDRVKQLDASEYQPVGDEV